MTSIKENEATKTPITVLQTYCARHNAVVDYDLISTHGRIHEPTFIYHVRVEGGDINFKAQASGMSKKKAKQMAALRVLEMIASKDKEIGTELKNLEPIYVNELVQETAPISANQSNPIGKLQETCVKKKWRPPVYETDDENGPPHDKVFTIRCRLDSLKIVARGVDRSKKGAKKFAAEEMIKILAERNLCEQSEKSDTPFDSMPMITSADDRLCKNGVNQVVEFFDRIKYDVRKEILERTKSITDYEDQQGHDFCADLEEIGKLMTCDVIYAPLHSKNCTFVILRNKLRDKFDIPILSGWGRHMSPNVARNLAAYTALTILRGILETLQPL